MYQNLLKAIANVSNISVSDERKQVLQPLIDYIQDKVYSFQQINLNFICTHNSRRSHFSQIWAQTMAYHFGVKNVVCYSGGTEATAMFSKVVETLYEQGFEIQKLSEAQNAVYAVKYTQNQHAIICFSKTYFHDFNPKTSFGAVMTCSSADEGCPVVLGAEAKFSIQYDDPKAFDETAFMNKKYEACSLKIASEMYYVFSKIILKQ